MVMTGNARAWRWVVTLRGSEHAETEIRELAVRALLCLKQAEPLLFGDMEVRRYSDSTLGVAAAYPKP